MLCKGLGTAYEPPRSPKGTINDMYSEKKAGHHMLIPLFIPTMQGIQWLEWQEMALESHYRHSNGRLGVG